MGLPKPASKSLVSFDAWPYPKRCAHRGAGKLAPENTLAAFRHGASFGYKMFEFDAKLSGDGVALLMHDPTLERTSNGLGRVAGKTFGELSQLDAGSWHSAAYAGETIPSLEAIARWLNRCPSPRYPAAIPCATSRARPIWRRASPCIAPPSRPRV